MGEVNQEVEIEIISIETIKPSSLLPPKTPPKTITLSQLDQAAPLYYYPLLLYYTTTTTTTPTSQHRVDIISSLKTSLSKTLDQFHPIAGRFVDNSTICCNHQGIPFIETKVDSNILDVMNSPQKMKLLTKFLPPSEFQAGTRPISELTHLAIQVNVFRCGGVIIGSYVLHKLLDGISIGTFFKYWSTIANDERVKDDDPVQPDFEVTITAFPPLTTTPTLPRNQQLPKAAEKPNNNPVKVLVTKSFVFDVVSLKKMISMAKSELVPKPTRFETVTGFIWEQTLSTLRNSGVEVEHTSLTMPVNIRPRMSPPLPRGSIGNLLRNAKAQANTSSSSGLQDLVKEIHLSLSQTTQKINTPPTTPTTTTTAIHSSLSQTTQKINTPTTTTAIPSSLSQTTQKINTPPTTTTTTTTAEVILTKQKVEQPATQNREGNYFLVSWCKLGLDEADFGFGKPIWVIPNDGRPPKVRNMIFLTDYRHPETGVEGIEAWITLEEKEMQCLRSNPVFLAFATPN